MAVVVVVVEVVDHFLATNVENLVTWLVIVGVVVVVEVGVADVAEALHHADAVLHLTVAPGAEALINFLDILWINALNLLQTENNILPRHTNFRSLVTICTIYENNFQNNVTLN